MESGQSQFDTPGSPYAGASAPKTYWAVAEPPPLPPPTGTRYARVRVRFAAWLVDLIPLLVLAVLLYWPVASDVFDSLFRAIPDRVRPGQTQFPEVQAAMGEAFANATPGFLRAGTLFQVGSLAYIAGTWLAFGRSPGMALFGIRIAREEDGGRPGVGRVIVRYGGYLLSAIPFLFGFAWALFDRRNQTWHDKLAGTVVVYGTASAPAGGGERAARRPSIGAVVDEAWTLFTRSPGEFIGAIAVVLVPGLIVLIPLVAVYLVLGQDQSIESVRSVRELFSLVGDPAAYQRYNVRMLGATAPTIWLSALMGFVGSMVAAALLGATAAAVTDAGRIESPDTVTRAVKDRLGTLVALGLAGGVISSAATLAIGLPILAIAATQTPDPRAIASVGAFAALAALVIAPASLYFGSIWLLAIVCAVRERLGVAASVRRAWRLSRHRMRWLAGISFVTCLGIAVVVAPIGIVPIGLLSEAYLQGQRLPIAFSMVLVGLISFVTAPLLSLAFGRMYQGAREDSERDHPAAAVSPSHADRVV